MRVSRAQAAENRQKVIDVASRLFRERGLDGIGLNDLMKGAGLTQGGFYKQFESKEDLVAQACTRAIQTKLEQWSAIAEKDQEHPFAALIGFYLNLEHRDALEDGCPLVALGSDVGRHGSEVKAAFEAGIRAHLEILDRYMPVADGENPRKKSMAVLATMVGALLLSRIVSDETLSKDFLDSAQEEIQHIVTD
ncbi:TetR/AcrR family transcriptional regulator [Beijerinckia indica]|uniref:Transcriptional regulator, TetR family n=1 Tax=Beijerinckia indica subsp. indica (strain ATCC 9039 / DSM 1715 / NCIMB 8712) TaxID=395963 RepID=B2IIV3_BEII9|nr:TetR/AcrR family transcriptional regulator [Beijerinckia indica]ACB96165.1 transcriptional regulator, TetR family [Beijerinckia indica subsp. indica ATCC 9039]